MGWISWLYQLRNLSFSFHEADDNSLFGHLLFQLATRF